MANLGNLKIQLVAAERNFRDEELFVPENVFSDAGAFVSIASNTTKTITGMLGGTVHPDTKIEDIVVDDLDALVIAGGSGSPRYLWDNEALLEKVRDAHKKGKIIGAICLSGAILAQAGILKGKRGTVFPTEDAISILNRNGVTYVNQGVVVSDNIVTAQGPENAKEFAQAVLSLVRPRIVSVG
ncbi:DJ-1 family protein [Methanocella sp. CWC-04]|uniref:DJ-1 family protein n=1 Tax=Methanooceanicella nereidis TaxID=2052831 RepID=A0AAP2RD25_9EURY|nr:DJ-1/PfpI family protein [Methanocella sp. CWC-04]MCD1294666.1 DJ-1 family protein [Methanocella sp. CWC-04]